MGPKWRRRRRRRRLLGILLSHTNQKAKAFSKKQKRIHENKIKIYIYIKKNPLLTHEFGCLILLKLCLAFLCAFKCLSAMRRDAMLLPRLAGQTSVKVLWQPPLELPVGALIAAPAPPAAASLVAAAPLNEKPKKKANVFFLFAFFLWLFLFRFAAFVLWPFLGSFFFQVLGFGFFFVFLICFFISLSHCARRFVFALFVLEQLAMCCITRLPCGKLKVE